MIGPANDAADPGLDSDDEWGAAPTHPESGGSEPTANGEGGTDDEWGPTADRLIADVEVRGAAAAVGRTKAEQPDPDDDWTAEDPFASAPAPAASDDWEAAPPLPMALPAARPKAERAPNAKRRGATRGRRGSSGRDDRRTRRADEDRREPGGDDGPDEDRRGRQADRPPPTAEERLQIALKHAYRFLAKRDRTEAEVRTHLEKRETDPASLEAAIGELLELRYLDDERYVQRYVEDRRRLDGWGPVRITQGLRKTGIDNALIAPAIDAVAAESADDDVTLATELIQRRFNHRPLADDKDRQKALRAVVSKGHSLDVAYAAVRAYEQRYAEDAGGMDHSSGIR